MIDYEADVHPDNEIGRAYWAGYNKRAAELAALETLAKTLAEDVASLTAALKPFAVVAGLISWSWTDDTALMFFAMNAAICEKLTIGDIRAAAKAMGGEVMEQKPVMQKVREAAEKRGMTIPQYMNYCYHATNDLTPEEQWDCVMVAARFVQTPGYQAGVRRPPPTDAQEG